MFPGKTKRTQQGNLLVMVIDGGDDGDVIMIVMMVDWVGLIGSLVKVAPITAALSAA